MKKIIHLTLFIISMLVLAGCTVTSEPMSQQIDSSIIEAAPTNVHEAVLEIEGMTCEGCAYGVEYQLKDIDGVIDAKILYKEGKGYVTYDADKVDSETIAQASTVYIAKVISDKKKQ